MKSVKNHWTLFYYQVKVRKINKQEPKTLNVMTNSTNFSLEDLSYNNDGLIPAIAQDWLDGSILMFAWMNVDSLQKTLKTKEVHYWSRSRSEIWRKGATSGNIQILKEIRFDCDNDALLLFIEQ